MFCGKPKGIKFSDLILFPFENGGFYVLSTGNPVYLSSQKLVQKFRQAFGREQALSRFALKAVSVCPRQTSI